jgi:DNA-binding transcriptional MerR regulator
MTIYDPSTAAEATGLSLDALRYYEREGLIGPIERSAGGRRRYDESDIAWIGIVTCLREAGLGIADLRRFTSLLRTQQAGGGAVDRVGFLRDRREELLERLRQTRSALKVLDDKIAFYSIEDGVS